MEIWLAQQYCVTVSTLFIYCMYILYHVPVIQYASGQGTCSVTGGNIGDSRYMLARTARNRDNFYLNVADPASCSGIINYFSYCYYRPEVATQLRSYVFTFAIYRENSSVDGTYDVVSSVFIAQRTSSDVTTDLGSGNFACVDFTVNDPVPVNAGDVLGACVSDPLVGVLVRQLDIVGRLIDGERGSSMLLRTDEATGCTPDSVPSSVIPSKMSESRLLHLYANIGRYIHSCFIFCIAKVSSLHSTSIMFFFILHACACRSRNTTSTYQLCSYHNGDCSCYHCR